MASLSAGTNGEPLRIWPADGHPIYRIPSQIAPWKDSMEETILQRTTAYGFADTPQSWQRLIESHHGELAARAYVDATPARREVIADWFTWIFVYDDFYDGIIGRREHGHHDLMAEMLAVLPFQAAGRSPCATGPLAKPLQNTWEAVAGLSLNWRIRFYQHIHGFLAAFRYESLGRARGEVPQMRYFRQIRRPASAVPACLDLLEYAVGTEVPPLIYQTDQFRILHTIAVDVVSWINDAISFHKEQRVGEVNNAVSILRRDRACTTQHAIDLIHGQIAHDISTFFRTEAELGQLCRDWTGLTSSERDAVAQCVSGMKRWMRGSLDWSRNSARYPQTSNSTARS